jgi:hypothetical protein
MRKLLAVLFATAIAGAFTGSAFGDPLHPKPKCNSGDGNGSEIVGTTDCDPGNSGNNNGGD